MGVSLVACSPFLSNLTCGSGLSLDGRRYVIVELNSCTPLSHTSARNDKAAMILQNRLPALCKCATFCQDFVVVACI